MIYVTLRKMLKQQYKSTFRDCIMHCLLRIVKILVKTFMNVKVSLLLCISVLICTLMILRTNRNTTILEVKPTTTAAEFPVIVWWTPGFPGVYGVTNCPNVKCEIVDITISGKFSVGAYLFYGSNINFSHLPLPRRRNVIWGLFHEESPRNVAQLMFEPVLNLFNYSSTFSRYSDVPFPLQYLESLDEVTSTSYFVTTAEKNLHLNEISPIMYLQSDCDTMTERDQFVKELMKISNIDSYGECLHNKNLPKEFRGDYLNNLNEDKFLKFIARYKFVIAIENGICNDYITEKFWRAIKVGTVPIYFGSPNIEDWLPNNKSAILLKDFPTAERLTEHITELLRDDALYEEYLRHKTEQVVTNKRLSHEFRLRPHQVDTLDTVEKFQCFICEELHKKSPGVNKVTQKHYECPQPISALTQRRNPSSDWMYTWHSARIEAQEINKRILNDR